MEEKTWKTNTNDRLEANSFDLVLLLLKQFLS